MVGQQPKIQMVFRIFPSLQTEARMSRCRVAAVTLSSRQSVGNEVDAVSRQTLVFSFSFPQPMTHPSLRIRPSNTSPSVSPHRHGAPLQGGQLGRTIRNGAQPTKLADDKREKNNATVLCLAWIRLALHGGTPGTLSLGLRPHREVLAAGWRQRGRRR